MSSKLLTGVLLGAAAGAVLGVLFAPDKGTETRKKLSEKGGELGQAARNKFTEFGETISEKYDSIRTEAGDMMRRNRDGKGTAQNAGQTAGASASETPNEGQRSFA